MKTLQTALVLVVLGCGPATNSTYRGEPVSAITGRMVLSDSAQLTGPVKLALLWYPAPRAGTQPKGLVTAEVSYTGAFPQDFSFEMYGPPTAEAITAQGIAFGALVAYEDLDGDGRLGFAPPGALPADRVVGSSMQVSRAPTADSFMVTYSTSASTLEGIPIPAGYGIARFDATPASATIEPAAVTSVALNLSGEPVLNMLICGDYFERVDPREACGLTLRTAPSRVSAFLGRNSFAGAVASVSIYEGSATATNGAVALNGVPLTVPGGASRYELNDPQTMVVRLGANVLRIAQPPYAPFETTLWMPDPILTGATNGQPVKAGETLQLSWPLVQYADREYLDVSATVLNSGQPVPRSLALGVMGGSYTLTVPPDAVSVDLFLTAKSMGSDPQGYSVINVLRLELPVVP